MCVDRGQLREPGAGRPRRHHPGDRARRGLLLGRGPGDRGHRAAEQLRGATRRRGRLRADRGAGRAEDAGPARAGGPLQPGHPGRRRQHGRGLGGDQHQRACHRG